MPRPPLSLLLWSLLLVFPPSTGAQTSAQRLEIGPHFGRVRSELTVGGTRVDCRDLLAGLALGLGGGAGVDVYLEGLTIRADVRRMVGQRRVNPEAATAVHNRATVFAVALLLF